MLTPQDTTACEFCTEFDRGSIRSELNQHLAGRSRFFRCTAQTVVLPSVSPIRPGHVLLLPASHRRSVRQCDEEELSELVWLARVISELIAREDESVAFFEHGVGDSAGSGCGVVHAHLHLVPLPICSIMAVSDEIARSADFIATGPWPTILRSTGFSDTYLSFGTQTDQILVDGAVVRSQWVRQMIAHHFGQESWDWRDFSHWEWFEHTLSILASTECLPSQR